MKKFIAIILAVALAMSLVACTSVEGTQACESEKRFTVVHGGGYEPTVYVDTETGVQYLVIRSPHGACMTMLVNADGTPMIWENWEAIK